MNRLYVAACAYRDAVDRCDGIADAERALFAALETDGDWLARAWKAKAKEYRTAAHFAEGVYRRRESRIRELRARIELAERIIQIARFWAAHSSELSELIRAWGTE